MEPPLVGGFAIRTMASLIKIYSKEYQALVNAYHRCHVEHHQAYHNYGGRGITVCEQWHPPFANALADFLATVGPAPSSDLTLDRIDNDKGYYPGNVAWRTRSEQQSNRRRPKISRNPRYVTYNGKTQLVSEWARELGIKHNTLIARLFYYNMPVELALQPGRVMRRKLN